VFGAILIRVNQKVLGQDRAARQAGHWVVPVLTCLTLAQLVPDSNSLGFLKPLVPIGLFVAWYYLSAKPHIDEVRSRFGAFYPRRGWAKPVTLALVALCAIGLMLDKVKPVSSREDRIVQGPGDPALNLAFVPVSTRELPSVLRTLESVDTNAAYVAAYRLARLGQPAMASLAERLSHTNAQVRLWATCAVGLMPGRHTNTAPALIRLLHDSNQEVRLAAAFALARMKLTNDPVREEIAQSIGTPALPLPDIFPMVQHESTVGPPICTIDSHLPQLVDENTRPDPEDLGIMSDGNHPNPRSFLEFVVRRTALDLAWKLYAQTADPAEFIDQLADPRQSQKAASVLWRMGPRALAPLTAALTDSDAQVREYAAIVLGCFGAQATQQIPELAALLQREHPTNNGHCRPCGAAAFALGRMMPASQTTLLDLLRGDQTTAAFYAAAQLARFPSAEIIAALIGCLNDPRQHVWTAAAFALGKIGPSAAAALPALREKFHAHTSTDGTLTVAVALEQIASGTGEITRRLLEMSKDEDAHVRESAIMATRILLESARDSRPARSRDLEPILQSLVRARDSEAGVRKETVRCLGLVAAPGEPVLSALEGALADENPNVQNYAALALANHGRLGAAILRLPCVTPLRACADGLPSVWDKSTLRTRSARQRTCSFRL
jgi:HEAT repeat protein